MLSDTLQTMAWKYTTEYSVFSTSWNQKWNISHLVNSFIEKALRLQEVHYLITHNSLVPKLIMGLRPGFFHHTVLPPYLLFKKTIQVLVSNLSLHTAPPLLTHIHTHTHTHTHTQTHLYMKWLNNGVFCCHFYLNH